MLVNIGEVLRRESHSDIVVLLIIVCVWVRRDAAIAVFV